MNIPWVEKYRPTELDSIILDEHLLKKLKNYTKENFTHLLFYGPPGIGKTTTALNIVRKLIKDKENFLELNASDNRGINMLSDFAQTFCKSRGSEGIKIIILDEADNITKKAQERLINFIENYPYIKFIFTCNDVTQIIESLQSRCTLIKFTKPVLKDVEKIIKHIFLCEKIKFTPRIIPELLLNSDFDIRKSINNMEAIYYLNGKITLSNTLKYFNRPSTHSIINLIHGCLKNNTKDKSMECVLEIVKNGLNILDLIITIINIFENYDNFEMYFTIFPISYDTGIKILEIAHKNYYRIIQSCESDLQLISFMYEIIEIET